MDKKIKNKYTAIVKTKIDFRKYRFTNIVKFIEFCESIDYLYFNLYDKKTRSYLYSYSRKSGKYYKRY